MRRVGVAVILAAGMVLAASAASWAAPTPAPVSTGTALKWPVPAAVKPATLCTISSTSGGAIDITGLVATKTGYIAVDGKNQDGWNTYIVHFTSKCKRTGSLKSYSGHGANDPQDLAIDKNGTLWVADIGDSDTSRQTVALWKVPSSGSMTLYHFAYPDGAHNASAMVLDSDGRPIFITRNPSGPASLYEPAAGPLKSSVTAPLAKVGTFAPEQTGTSSPYGLLGENWITGGANSPDGTKVVLRTSSDAYEWTVSGGDVVGAITKGTPTITPMPQPYESFGEAIAFTADGTGFLSVAKTTDSTPLLRYTPATPVASSGKGAAVAGPKKPSAFRAWFNGLTLTELQLMLGGVALLGLILVLIGVLGIRNSRKKFRLAARKAAKAGAAPPGAAGVYGSPAGPAGPGGAGGPGGGVYGTPPGGGRGGVYGAPPGGAGGVYGGASEPGYDPYAGGYDGQPPADPYGPRPGPPRPGGQPPGGEYGGGQYGGAQSGGGQYGGGQYSGGGYGGGEYGGPGSEPQPGAGQPHSSGPYPPGSYAPDPYTPDPYSPGAYPQDQYVADQYPSDPYPDDAHAADPYRNDPYPGDRYSNNQYPSSGHEGEYDDAPHRGGAYGHPPAPGGDQRNRPRPR